MSIAALNDASALTYLHLWAVMNARHARQRDRSYAAQRHQQCTHAHAHERDDRSNVRLCVSCYLMHAYRNQDIFTFSSVFLFGCLTVVLCTYGIFYSSRLRIEQTILFVLEFWDEMLRMHYKERSTDPIEGLCTLKKKILKKKKLTRISRDISYIFTYKKEMQKCIRNVDFTCTFFMSSLKSFSPYHFVGSLRYVELIRDSDSAWAAELRRKKHSSPSF